MQVSAHLPAPNQCHILLLLSPPPTVYFRIIQKRKMSSTVSIDAAVSYSHRVRMFVQIEDSFSERDGSVRFLKSKNHTIRSKNT